MKWLALSCALLMIVNLILAIIGQENIAGWACATMGWLLVFINKIKGEHND